MAVIKRLFSMFLTDREFFSDKLEKAFNFFRKETKNMKFFSSKNAGFNVSEQNGIVCRSSGSNEKLKNSINKAKEFKDFHTISQSNYYHSKNRRPVNNMNPELEKIVNCYLVNDSHYKDTDRFCMDKSNEKIFTYYLN